MKLELNVVRFENEDVIATSCSKDVVCFGGSTYHGYTKSLYDVYGVTAFEDVMDHLNANWEDEEEAIENQGKAYHVLANGTIEVCNDPLAHYNNFKDNSDWECEEYE